MNSIIESLKSIYSSLELTECLDRSDNFSLPAVRALYLQQNKKKENLKRCTQIEATIADIEKKCPVKCKLKPVILELSGESIIRKYASWILEGGVITHYH